MSDSEPAMQATPTLAPYVSASQGDRSFLTSVVVEWEPNSVRFGGSDVTTVVAHPNRPVSIPLD